MNQERIKSLLLALGSEATGDRPGWVLARCPFRWNHGGMDSHPSFAISYDPKKKSRFKCLSCGASGDLMDLLFDLRSGLKKAPGYSHFFRFDKASYMVNSEFEGMELTADDIPEFDAPPPRDEVIFSEGWLSSFKPVFFFKNATEYCVSRGVLPSTLEALDVRYDPTQNRVGFPFRNFRGELMGMQGRYIGDGPVRDEDNPKAPLRYFQYGFHGKRNNHVWMGEHKVNLDEPVVLCEGPFDFAKIFQTYPNVLASFTTGLSRTKIRRISDASELITFYDHGKGGDAARGLIRTYLPSYPVVDIVPTKEEDDAGSMDDSTIAFYLSEHVKLL